MRRALCIGCNYPGKDCELHGCVNDVLLIRQLLVQRFGFSDQDITVMIDTDQRYMQPNSCNIFQTLGTMIQQSRPGDVLVVHYSGHGTHVVSDDGEDEAIVPTDLAPITNATFKLLLKNLHPEVQFTAVMDCCHSEFMLDQPKADVQVRDFNFDQEAQAVHARSFLHKNRDLPHHYWRQLAHQHHNGNMERGIPFINELIDPNSVGWLGQGNLQGLFNFLAGKYGGQGGDPWQFLKVGDLHQFLHQTAFAQAAQGQLVVNNDYAILISGCKDQETSADANFNGVPNGALTYAVNYVLKKYPPGQLPSNRTLVTQVRAFLASASYTQHPCLSCSATHADAAFITRGMAGQAQQYGGGGYQQQQYNGGTQQYNGGPQQYAAGGYQQQQQQQYTVPSQQYSGSGYQQQQYAARPQQYAGVSGQGYGGQPGVGMFGGGAPPQRFAGGVAEFPEGHPHHHHHHNPEFECQPQGMFGGVQQQYGGGQQQYVGSPPPVQQYGQQYGGMPQQQFMGGPPMEGHHHHHHHRAVEQY